MRKNWLISRRTCLKGVGISIALPLLETMGWADPPRGQSYKPPVRLGFMYMALGVYPREFWPDDAKTWPVTLPPSLEPLRPVIGQCLVLDGIENIDSGPLRTTHELELSTWLTATRPDAARKEIIAISQSADQIAAQHLGLYTVLPSLELGIQDNSASGVDNNSGLHKMYFTSGSFLTATQALPVETSPANVLKRLFSSRQSTARKKGGPVVDAAKFAGSGSGGGSEDQTLDRSMLDLVMEGAKDLARTVSSDDQRRIGDYLDTVRSLETRVAAIERQQAEAAKAKAGAGRASSAAVAHSDPIEVRIPAEGKPKWSEHVKVMGDLMVLAFQTDVTRVSTLITSHPFGLYYPELNFSDWHHDLSHHDKNLPEQFTRLAMIDRFNVEQLAYVIGRMKSLREGAGTLLDSTILLWGSGMGMGQYHTHTRLPTIIAGGGGGTIRSGRYVAKAGGNQGDLLTAILSRAGVPLERPLGNGTKLLPDLS